MEDREEKQEKREKRKRNGNDKQSGENVSGVLDEFIETTDFLALSDFLHQMALKELKMTRSLDEKLVISLRRQQTRSQLADHV